MRLNAIAIRIWLITFVITIFSFIITTVFYGVFLSGEVKNNYMNDFEEIILNVERLVVADPHFLLENMDTINDLHSSVNFALLMDDTFEEEGDNWYLPFSDEVKEIIQAKPGVLENIDRDERVQIRSDQHREYRRNIPHVFHILPVTIEGQDVLFYSFADLSL